MRRALYTILVSLHPRRFRDRFGAEMIEIFDAEIRRGTAAKLLLDGAASVVRQRFLRSSPPEPVIPPVPLAHGLCAPSFRILDEALPRRSALVNGALLSLFLAFGLGFAASRGSGKLHGMLIGAKYPRPQVLPVDRASVMQADPTTEVHVVSPKPDPWDELARIYFDIVRLLRTLDADGDRIISAWEIVTAASPLRRLDRDGDGELDAEECGFVWDKGVDPTITNRARMQFMRIHPVLGALDADRDGLISLKEIEGASIALRALDKNGDGSLSPAEVLPERIDSRAAMILSRLDKDRDRRLSAQEKANERAGRLRSLLDSADRNGDGIATAAELTTELQLRDATKRIEEAAKGARETLNPKRK